jgi:hypothetical protein
MARHVIRIALVLWLVSSKASQQQAEQQAEQQAAQAAQAKKVNHSTAEKSARAMLRIPNRG